MRNRARGMLLVAALLLAPAFTLPLWSIRIVAPQYRDGLGMYIGAREIRGHTEHDIQNINILNHYIGMKPIVPSEVDVLDMMPWALALLAGGALVAAAVARRWAVAAWLGLFLLLGGAGLYEFHSWNYDYGHNLSPDAPLKVPGMTYQPPLIGTTTLLTIRASSYPSWGTLFLGLAFALGVTALVVLWRRPRRAEGLSRRSYLAAAALLMVSVAVGACGPGSAAGTVADTVEFAPDQPPCDFCDGRIPAERFGGEVVMTDGARYRFMSVECLAGFIVAGRVSADRIRSIRVVDYSHGERLIDATTAHYVRSQTRSSPNGLNLLAAEAGLVAHNLHFFFGGTRLSWPEVLELVRQEWTT